jgi:hypothetical protein
MGFEVGDRVIIDSLRCNLILPSWSDFHGCKATVTNIKDSRVALSFDVPMSSIKTKTTINYISFNGNVHCSSRNGHPHVIKTGNKRIAIQKIKKHGFK